MEIGCPCLAWAQVVFSSAHSLGGMTLTLFAPFQQGRFLRTVQTQPTQLSENLLYVSECSYLSSSHSKEQGRQIPLIVPHPCHSARLVHYLEGGQVCSGFTG